MQQWLFSSWKLDRLPVDQQAVSCVSALWKGLILGLPGLLHHWVSVMRGGGADRREKTSHVSPLKLSGALAGGGPLKSDGINWLQWA